MKHRDVVVSCTIIFHDQTSRVAHAEEEQEETSEYSRRARSLGLSTLTHAFNIQQPHIPGRRCRCRA
eukprot:scaffold228491_cov33-Tisochrysis_lutea.AAC.1